VRFKRFGIANETNAGVTDPGQRGSSPQTARRASPVLQISAFVAAWLLLVYVLMRHLALAWIPLIGGGFVSCG
jgi:hypothetical protein